MITSTIKTAGKSSQIISGILALLLGSFIYAPALAAADETEKEDKTGFLFDAYVPLDTQAIDAISRAQEWLAKNQRADGGWDTMYGHSNVGEISFALLALMVNGSVPGEGKYSTEIGKTVQFLLNSQRESGLICGADTASTKAPMYQHALATLALTEIYGMSGNPRIKNAIISAVNLIVETQHSAGGWRYQPKMEPGDISATVMQVMALRSAVEAGIYVPEETIERAVKFIKSCYNKKEKGFGYMNANDKAAFARTAAGIVSIQTVGLHKDPIVPDAIAYVMDATFNNEGAKKGEEKDSGFRWYGHYYASVALYHYGGESWKKYYPGIKQVILKEWSKSGHGANVLDTAWQIMILGVPYRYLPIYQR